MERINGREKDELREIKITRNFTKYAAGSVLIETGDTKVICTAFIEDRVPPFLKNQGKGWVSAEYNMLPSSTETRKTRDINRLKLDGRSGEIQRLIGRSLRSCVDMDKLGERTVWIDCDVIQADGGTRVASVTGGFVALYDALASLVESGALKEMPLKHFLAAISVGIVKDEILLDLCYQEDSSAMADMNVVMTDSGEFIEIQATSEMKPIKEEEFDQLLFLAKKGIYEIIEKQKKALEIK